MSSTPARAEAPGRLRLGRCLLLPALLASLAGCAMIGPDFARPSTPEIDGWLAANAPSRDATSGLTARSAPVVTWWETFGDLTLDALIAEAYAQNLDLQVAGARVMRARAQHGIARGELFPQ